MFSIRIAVPKLIYAIEREFVAGRGRGLALVARGTLKVRFPPNRDHCADVPSGPSRAKNDRLRCKKIASSNGPLPLGQAKVGLTAQSRYGFDFAAG